MSNQKVITNAWVYQTPLKTFKKKNIYIKDDKCHFITDDFIKDFSGEVIDASNQYVVPGLIDSHMHIESSMTTPSIFSEAVLRYGVTTVIADAHEIANVKGLEGLNYFMSAKTVLDIFYAIPSSVPSTLPELETTGGIIGLKEVAELLKDPRIICLGEAMNFKGIAYEPDSLISKIIKLCQKERPTMPLEGHIPKIYGQELADFLYSGITSDHTHQFPEHLVEKINAGLFIQFQKKSITAENMAVIRDNNLYDYACLITDDVMADDLIKGHLNEDLKLAVKAGLPVEQAIYMTTYTPARRMGLHDRGMIAPGCQADLIILDDLDRFSIASVLKSGNLVYQKGNPVKYPEITEPFPASYQRSVKCKNLTKEDLILRVKLKNHETSPRVDQGKSSGNRVRCHVIQKHDIGTFTNPLTRELEVTNGRLVLVEQTSHIIVMERYGKNGNIAHGLIHDAIEEKGAIATTWAHDHHNVMVMGNDEESILTAQHHLLSMQGGYVVVKEGTIIAECPLPIGGILSLEPIEELGEKLLSIRNAMRELGYHNQNEIMSFSTLSLPVSPAIKMTDKGMMDTKTQQFYPLIFPEDGVLLNDSTD